MIFYYTKSQRTKVFAQILGELKGQSTYELVADINKKSAFGFMISALWQSITNKTTAVTNMPQDIPSEIFVCAPIWAERLATPVKYFLENANLQGVRVNLLLTASNPTEKYKQTAFEYLRTFSCIPGDIFLFATSGKVMPDEQLVREHLSNLLDIG